MKASIFAARLAAMEMAVAKYRNGDTVEPDQTKPALPTDSERCDEQKDESIPSIESVVQSRGEVDLPSAESQPVTAEAGQRAEELAGRIDALCTQLEIVNDVLRTLVSVSR